MNPINSNVDILTQLLDNLSLESNPIAQLAVEQLQQGNLPKDAALTVLHVLKNHCQHTDARLFAIFDQIITNLSS